MKSFWKAIWQYVPGAKIESYPLTWNFTVNNNHSPGGKLKFGKIYAKIYLLIITKLSTNLNIQQWAYG